MTIPGGLSPSARSQSPARSDDIRALTRGTCAPHERRGRNLPPQPLLINTLRAEGYHEVGLGHGASTTYGQHSFGFDPTGNESKGSRWRSKVVASAAQCATQPRPTRQAQQCAIAGIAKIYWQRLCRAGSND